MIAARLIERLKQRFIATPEPLVLTHYPACETISPLGIDPRLSKLDQDEMLTLARNPETDAETLQQLMWLAKSDPGQTNRLAQALINNANTPFGAVIDRLAQPYYGLGEHLRLPYFITTEQLEQLASYPNKLAQVHAATHSNTSAEILLSLTTVDGIDIGKAVARHDANNSTILERLTDYWMGHEYGIEVLALIASNTRISPSTVSKLMYWEGAGDNHRVLRQLISNTAMPLELKKELFESKIPSHRYLKGHVFRELSPILRKHENIRVEDDLSSLMEAQINLEKLTETTSLKKLCTLVTGSKHPEEIKLLLHGETARPGLPNLFKQVFFNEQKNKLDRHNYLKFITEINKKPNRSWLQRFNDPQMLRNIIQTFGTKPVVALHHNSNSHIYDTLRMMNDCLNCRNPVLRQESINEIQEWLDVQEENEYFERISQLHDHVTYLAREVAAQEEGESLSRGYPQASIQPLVDEINLEICKDDWEIVLPGNFKELTYIGKAQHHCVGSLGYHRELHKKENFIFLLSPLVLGKRKDSLGYTFEFYVRKQTLRQAHGFANKNNPSKKTIEYATALAMRLIKSPEFKKAT